MRRLEQHVLNRRSYGGTWSAQWPWIASAVAILTTGFLTHAHWIWMAGLLVVWRLVQDYVNSPRIMGDNRELQPLTVIFALMVGGQL